MKSNRVVKLKAQLLTEFPGIQSRTTLSYYLSFLSNLEVAGQKARKVDFAKDVRIAQARDRRGYPGLTPAEPLFTHNVGDPFVELVISATFGDEAFPWLIAQYGLSNRIFVLSHGHEDTEIEGLNLPRLTAKVLVFETHQDFNEFLTELRDNRDFFRHVPPDLLEDEWRAGKKLPK